MAASATDRMGFCLQCLFSIEATGIDHMTKWLNSRNILIYTDYDALCAGFFVLSYQIIHYWTRRCCRRRGR